MIDTDTVRRLYAEADHYDADHARRALNEAEFNDWLATHDAETNWHAAEALYALLGKLPGTTWSRERDVLDEVAEHVEKAREFAREQGVKVPEKSDGR